MHNIPKLTHPTDKANFTRLAIGDNFLYFSHETPIAFACDENLYVRKNIWGPTTGKHLKYAKANYDQEDIHILEEAEFLAILNYKL